MPGNRVYIGNVPSDCRDSDVERFCRDYGDVRNIVLKNGYGFVEFQDERDADDAIYHLNGSQLLGVRVVLEPARGPSRRFNPARALNGRGVRRFGPPSRTRHRLLVENLSSSVDWKDLKDCMRQAGTVTYADAHKDRMREGLVEFSSYRELRYALDRLDGTKLKGRRIRLVDKSDEARADQSRHRSSSRSSYGSDSRDTKSRRRRSRSDEDRRRRSRSSVSSRSD